jgi:hypothetical protein
VSLAQHPTLPRLTVPRHKAIIAYLVSANLPTSAAALKNEIGIGDSFDEKSQKGYETLLVKKWTSVVRLQKRVGPVLLSFKDHC